MKTEEIKEELDRELEEATPSLNEERVKKHKIKLIDDSTIAAHKTMDRLRLITAGVLLIVFAVSLALIITNLVDFDKPMKTEVTCYVVMGLLSERVHVVTKNGEVLERFSLDSYADKYMEYNDELKNYKGMEAADYIYYLISAMIEGTKQKEVEISLQAINNSYDKTKESLQEIDKKITQRNVGAAVGIVLKTQPIQHSAYNDIIHLNKFISDLDAELDIILQNDVKNIDE